MHEVAKLLTARAAGGSLPRDRTDGASVALVIEGGGMRAAIPVGMLLALEALGLTTAFDHVYGSSAGAIGGAWLLSGAAAVGELHWTRPDLRLSAINARNLLRGRPVVDGRHLLDVIYEGEHAMPFDTVLANETTLHPIATDAKTGAAIDLAPLIRDRATLKLALRASMALPLLAGRPVTLDDRLFFDGGIAQPVPYRSAIDDGATHILVLRSRRADEQHPVDSARAAAVARRYLRRHSDGLAAAYTDRTQRLIDDDHDLDTRERDPKTGPKILSLRPAAGTPRISRLERDQTAILSGIRAGDTAVTAAFSVRE